MKNIQNLRIALLVLSGLFCIRAFSVWLVATGAVHEVFYSTNFTTSAILFAAYVICCHLEKKN
jgi:hypothetical protein